MKQKKVWEACVVLMLGMQILSGCKAGETAQTEKIHVGVTYYNQSDTFLNEMLSSFREEPEISGGNI